MKIRRGFVSNSRWKAHYSAKQEKWAEEHPDWHPDTTFEKWAKQRIEGENFSELFYEVQQFSEVSELECHCPFDGTYIGLDPSSMQDDETMGEFKVRAREGLAKLIEGEFKCGWHSCAWGDR